METITNTINEYVKNKVEQFIINDNISSNFSDVTENDIFDYDKLVERVLNKNLVYKNAYNFRCFDYKAHTLNDSLPIKSLHRVLEPLNIKIYLSFYNSCVKSSPGINDMIFYTNTNLIISFRPFAKPY
jgi:hypothetical protein